MMPNVTLANYNTIAITAASGVYRLKFPDPGYERSIDLLNLGPGAVFLREDADPVLNDANSLSLPANWAINKLSAGGSVGVNIIAAADTTLSVRLT